MAGIQFTIGKNRLDRAFFFGIERDKETGVKCDSENGEHHMILPLLDSGVEDCQWGRASFQIDMPDDAVCYLYLCAMNEPLGKDFMLDESMSFREKIKFLASNRCLRFINKSDVLLYEIEGRYLWIAVEIVGEGVALSDMVISAPGDNFMGLFPEVYREKNGFLHRYLSIFSSLYQDFQDDIDHMENLVNPEKMSPQLLEIYLKWFGIDVTGGYISEEIMRALLKEVAWLMANKGTRRCIERICELFIDEKPIVLERNVMNKYIRKSQAEVYNNLYGDGPYDVTLLINSKVEITMRRQLLHLLEQFKPIRCRLAVVFLENSGVLDGYNYLDSNACVYTSSIADLDEQQLMDGTVVIQ